MPSELPVMFCPPSITDHCCTQTWDFSVGKFDELLLTLFKRYAELLKKRFSDDFQEVRCNIMIILSLLIES
jgi:hypothetical protein